MVVTPWLPGESGGGGDLVRRISFKFPAPKEVPDWVARLVGIPRALEFTLTARLHCTDEKITLHMPACFLNAPYGDHYRMEEVFTFTQNATGGINITKSIGVVWLKPMPWAFTPAKRFLEHKVKKDSASHFEHQMEIMRLGLRGEVRNH